MDGDDTNSQIYAGLHSEGDSAKGTQSPSARETQPAKQESDGQSSKPDFFDQSPEEKFLILVRKNLHDVTEHDVRSMFRALNEVKEPCFPTITAVDVGKIRHVNDTSDTMSDSDVVEVDITQIHDDFEGEPVLLAMVVGDVGSGKSIITNKYAILVSQGQVQALKRMRIVHHVQAQCLQTESMTNAFNLLFTQQIPGLDDQDVIDAGEELVKKNASEVLLIVDGLDQCGEPFGDKTYAKVKSGDKATANTILYNIFTNHMYPGMKILATCRWFTYWKLLNQFKPSKTMALRGFSENHFEKVMQQLSPTPDKIIKHLKNKSPALLPLCRIPLFAVYIAAIFSEDPENLPDTFVSVMISVLKYFIRSNHDDADVDSLAKLAFEGMVKNRFIFEPRFLRHNDIKVEKVLKGPMITNALTQSEMEKVVSDDLRLQFLHQSIQEGFAALHLLNLSDEKLEIFVSKGEWNSAGMEIVRKIFCGLVMNPKTRRMAGNLIPDESRDLWKTIAQRHISELLEESPLTNVKAICLLHECGSEVISQHKEKIRHVTVKDRRLRPGEDYAIASVLRDSVPLKNCEISHIVLNPSTLQLLREIAAKTEQFTISFVVVGELISKDDYPRVQAFFDEITFQTVILGSADDVSQSFLRMGDTVAMKSCHRIGLRGEHSNETLRALGRFIAHQSLSYLIFWNVRLTASKLASFCNSVSPESKVHRICLQEDKNMPPAAYGELPRLLAKLNSKYLVFASVRLTAQKLKEFNDSQRREMDTKLSSIFICDEQELGRQTWHELTIAMELSRICYLGLGYMPLSDESLNDLVQESATKTVKLKKLGFEFNEFLDCGSFGLVANILVNFAAMSLYASNCGVTAAMLECFTEKIRESKYSFPIIHLSERHVMPPRTFEQLGSLLDVARIRDLILGGRKITLEKLACLRDSLEKGKNELKSIVLYADDPFPAECCEWLWDMFALLQLNRDPKNQVYDDVVGEEIITREFSDLSWTLLHGIIRAKYMAVSSGKKPDPPAMEYIATIIGHPNLDVLWMDECELGMEHFDILFKSLQGNKYSKLSHLILSQNSDNECRLSRDDVLSLSKLLRFVMAKLQLRGFQLHHQAVEIFQEELDKSPDKKTEVVIEKLLPIPSTSHSRELALTIRAGCREKIMISESTKATIDSSGGEISIANSLIQFPKGSMTEATKIILKMEFNSSEWPRKDEYLCISPMLYVGGKDHQPKPGSVKIGTWCINGDLEQKAKAVVFHRPHDKEEWEIINELPFDDNPSFQFECSDFSPVIIAIPPSSLSVARYVIEGGLFVARRENNFVADFRLRNIPDGNSLWGLEQLLPFNTIQIKRDDNITLIINCEPGDCQFRPNREFSFKLDEDFIRCNRRVQFRFTMEGVNDGPFSVPVKYTIRRNSEALDGGEHCFTYVWTSPLANFQEAGRRVVGKYVATDRGTINIFQSETRPVETEQNDAAIPHSSSPARATVTQSTSRRRPLMPGTSRSTTTFSRYASVASTSSVSTAAHPEERVESQEDVSRSVSSESSEDESSPTAPAGVMAAEKLSDEDVVLFREAFGKFDADASNHVATENIGSVLRAAGQAPTESDLKEYEKELDSKETGEVEYQALLDLFARIIKSNLEMDDELNAAFRVLDKDLDGVISAADLRHYLTTLGEVLSQEEIDELIKDGDSSGEGKINYEEFCYTLLNDNM